ncbi:hypothetical protein BB560_000223 [Smittium megazygosporum]|uniref:CHCH domain-containing protein n=1 Tax=Smittium megazygosporum TaxID=133381 RepID=A0A2T9ZL28_9FUNG|nr:hypothetical protein BB560_000223 [Smittium megazygosporum]
MSFGGPKHSPLNNAPPDRGSFPLDHFGECKTQMLKYIECIKSESDHSNCRELSKVYLDCRMRKNLMDKADFKELGFLDEDKNP